MNFLHLLQTYASLDIRAYIGTSVTSEAYQIYTPTFVKVRHDKEASTKWVQVKGIYTEYPTD